MAVPVDYSSRLYDQRLLYSYLGAYHSANVRRITHVSVAANVLKTDSDAVAQPKPIDGCGYDAFVVAIGIAGEGDVAVGLDGLGLHLDVEIVVAAKTIW